MESSVENEVSLFSRDKEESPLKSEDHEKQKLLDWLSPLKFWTRHDEVHRKRCEGTCDWLLHTERYKDWIAGSTPTLLCLGIRMLPLRTFSYFKANS